MIERLELTVDPPNCGICTRPYHDLMFHEIVDGTDTLLVDWHWKCAVCGHEEAAPRLPELCVRTGLPISEQLHITRIVVRGEG